MSASPSAEKVRSLIEEKGVAFMLMFMSVGWLVGRSAGRSIGWSVGPTVRFPLDSANGHFFPCPTVSDSVAVCTTSLFVHALFVRGLLVNL